MAEEMLVLAGSAEELGGVFLVCMVVASLSVISMVLFACGSSDSKNKRQPEVRAAGAGSRGGGGKSTSASASIGGDFGGLNFLGGLDYDERRDFGGGVGAHHHSGGGGGHHGGGGCGGGHH